jgi:hypothetical protein
MNCSWCGRSVEYKLLMDCAHHICDNCVKQRNWQSVNECPTCKKRVSSTFTAKLKRGNITTNYNIRVDFYLLN